MKKVISMSVKPLAIATAFAAGTTASMIVTALPGGGDTLGAAKAVNESICRQGVSMTISGGSRSVTTGTGTCQLRTLPPTKGLVLTESSPAGATVTDSSAMVNAGGELYKNYVGGKRAGATLLTPNRSLATSHAITYASGNGGSLSADFAASVQPVSGLQSNWLVGTYRILNSIRANGQVADGIEQSAYAIPNFAKGKLDFTDTMQVQFNGDNTCTVQDVNHHWAAGLYTDPLLNGGVPEMDVACTSGGGGCGQNNGNNYVSHGVINMGTTGSLANGQAFDWNDTYIAGDGIGLYQESCTYSVDSAAGQVSVSYGFTAGDTNDVPSMSHVTWTSTYNVSSDLRYLVSDGVSATEGFKATGSAYEPKGGISVGVRQGSPTLVGNTYLFNSRDGIQNETTASTPSYEAPVSAPYQEQECFSTGSLQLAAAGACTYNVVNTCTSRTASGYEENTSVGLNGGAPTVGAGSGTIVDSLSASSGAPSYATTCSWSGTASNLVVNVASKDANGGNVTVQYTGSASDNGEALVLQGVYNIAGAGLGDTTNTPILPIQRYNMASALVAQQYQGTLTADADSDGTNNYGEFTAVTKLPKKSNANDFNGDGVADVMMLNSNGNWAYSFPFANGQSAGYAFSQLFPDQLWEIKSTEDYDGDGITDVLMRRSDLGIWFIFKMGGSQGTAQSYANFGLFGGAYEIVATGDFDNTGNRSIIMENPGTGEYWRFTVQNGAVTSQAAAALFGGTWQIESVADFNGDGTDDVVMHDPSSGSYFIFNMQGGNVSSNAPLGLYGGTWVIRATADFNGDGTKDILMRNSADGDWRVFLMANGAVSSVVNPGLFPASSWDFSFASDTNGDGITDVVFQNASNGLWFVGLMDNTATATNQVFNLWDASSWLLSSVGDYDGDGTDDVILKNTANGAFYTFPVSGGQVQPFLYSQLFLIPAPTTWGIVQ